MICEAVLPGGLDIARAQKQGPKQHPNDDITWATLVDFQSGPRYTERDEHAVIGRCCGGAGESCSHHRPSRHRAARVYASGRAS